MWYTVQHVITLVVFFPACFPVLGSDHRLITFDVVKHSGLFSQAPTWRIGPVNWSEALRSDPDGLRAWHVLVEQAETVPLQCRQIVLDVLHLQLVRWLWARSEAFGGVR